MADQNQVETAKNVLIPEYQISEAMELAQFYCKHFHLPLDSFYTETPPDDWQPPRKFIANAGGHDDFNNKKQKDAYNTACSTANSNYRNIEKRNKADNKKEIWTALQTLARIHLHAHLITPFDNHNTNLSVGSEPKYGRLVLNNEGGGVSGAENIKRKREQIPIDKNAQANALVHAIFSPKPTLTIKPSFWGNKYYNGNQKLKSFSKKSHWLKVGLITLGVAVLCFSLIGFFAAPALIPLIVSSPLLGLPAAGALTVVAAGVTMFAAAASNSRFNREAFQSNDKNNEALSIPKAPDDTASQEQQSVQQRPALRTEQDPSPKRSLYVGADVQGLAEQQHAGELPTGGAERSAETQALDPPGGHG